MRLIDALDYEGHSISESGGEVTSPASFSSLVRLGGEALPTIIAVARETQDDWTRDLLLDVIGRIGDPAGAPLLLHFLGSPKPNTRSEALEALSRLAMPESQPVLQALLQVDPAESGFDRMRLLEGLYRVGDHSVLGEVLDLAFADADQQFSAVQILSRHGPIRRALGFEGQFEEGGFVSAPTHEFLLAAKEWYVETVLGQPSPWKAPTDFAFTEPYATEKRQAFAFLLEQVRKGDDDYSNIRLLPADVASLADRPAEPLTFVHGWGHGGSLMIDAWRPDNGAVRLHRFIIPGNRKPVERCSYREAVVTTGEFARLRAGLRAITKARRMLWWSGPHWGGTSSSANFAVLVTGLGEDAARGFCGYQGSLHRLQYTSLCAARDWHHQFLVSQLDDAPESAGLGAKRVFAEVFRATQERWSDDSGWWWVRERMLALAAAFGDETLIQPLATYLQNRFVEGAHGEARTATAACAALAAITRVELRFHEDGSPRTLPDAARAYREHLGGK